MSGKIKIKIAIDFLMTVILLILMAYQITGQKFHEWFGAGMLILFLAHNILNYKWYKNLFKGKYTVLRVVQSIINISVLASMLCLAYSGIVMSRYVFHFISVSGKMALTRQMHMAAAYWGFVLMSIHIGMHWGMLVSMAGKILKGKKMPVGILWLLRFAAAIIAGYGAVCFYKADIVSYMLLKNQFVFFDFSKSVFVVFVEYIAMMGLWIFVSYYFVKGIKRILSVGKKGGKP